MTKPILFPVDLDEGYRAALPHVCAWADALGAKILLFHCLDVYYLAKYGYPFAPLSQEAVEGKAREAAEAFLHRIRRENLLADRPVEVCLVSAPEPAGAILEAAQSAALVAMASPVHTVLGRLLLGSVTSRVLAGTPGPVLVCPYARDHVPPPREAPARYGRILVATDLSPGIQDLARSLTPLIRTWGSTVELVHVVDEALTTSYVTVGYETLFDIEPDLQDRVRKKLLAQAPGFFPDAPCHVHVFKGRPARDLTRFAREHGVDLIAMATHGLDSLEDRFLGSTTERVVRTAPCPVYAVRVG